MKKPNFKTYGMKILKLRLSLCSRSRRKQNIVSNFNQSNQIQSHSDGKALSSIRVERYRGERLRFSSSRGLLSRSFEDGKGRRGGRVNDGIHAQALGFALNGGGGRASEIKRPVDGLFSCAVMYGLPSSNHLPPSTLFASPPLEGGEGRDLPRRPGQFRCDKEVDRDGRYAASSLSPLCVCVCVECARARDRLTVFLKEIRKFFLWF